jgi:hypothetical protein
MRVLHDVGKLGRSGQVDRSQEIGISRLDEQRAVSLVGNVGKSQQALDIAGRKVGDDEASTAFFNWRKQLSCTCASVARFGRSGEFFAHKVTGLRPARA